MGPDILSALPITAQLDFVVIQWYCIMSTFRHRSQELYGGKVSLSAPTAH